MPAPPTLQILEPLYGGDFSTRGGDNVPFVLPGELVALAQPKGLTLLKVSPQRTLPECIHFGTCGGCHYQHAAYPLQLELKQQILQTLLPASLPEIATYHADPWAYRNRIRLRIQVGHIGYNRSRSNEFLPIQMCPIAAPLLFRAAQALLAVGRANSRWVEAADEVELFSLADQSRLQMSLFLREADSGWATPESFTALCGELQVTIPELTGAGAELSPELNRRHRRNWTRVGWGAPGMIYAAAGRHYWVSRGTFFQVNRRLVETMVELVCAATDPAIEIERHPLAWDLFAGVGLFTAPLAERFSRVIAVEAAEDAARDLAALAKRTRGSIVEAIRSPVLDFLRTQQTQRERPALVVLDPPRAGLGAEGSAILARIAPQRIVYVSCDPETLGRDLAVLTRETYRIEAVALVDMFPQTFHIETVVRLVRRSQVERG